MVVVVVVVVEQQQQQQQQAYDAIRRAGWDVSMPPYPKDRAPVAEHLAVHSWTDEMNELEELDARAKWAVDSE